MIPIPKWDKIRGNFQKVPTLVCHTITTLVRDLTYPSVGFQIELNRFGNDLIVGLI